MERINFKVFWEALGDVPVTEDGEIDTPFLHFEKGTDILEIWHYLEDTYDVTLGDIINGK